MVKLLVFGAGANGIITIAYMYSTVHNSYGCMLNMQINKQTLSEVINMAVGLLF